MNNSWTRAARCAALAALLCVPQMSCGQDDIPGGPSSGLGGLSDDFGSLFAPKQADSVFDQYASLKRLASAWRDMDSSLMTDAALQFAEGERVLFRSHKLITASQAFDLAIRMATENKDKESLGRLAKALERSGDKDRLGQVNLALKTAGTARSANPDLDSPELQAQAAIQHFSDEIQSARVSGNKDHLLAIEKSLAASDLPDKQRAALAKLVLEAKGSLPEGDDVNSAAKMLDDLSGIGRPISVINPPKGNKFVKIDFSKIGPTDKQEIAEVTQWLKTTGETPQLIGNDADGSLNVLSKLQSPSRIGFRYSAYNNYFGISNIWQYTNQGAIKEENKCCGQAAIATMRTYWNRTTYPPMSDNRYVDELVGMYPPDGYGPLKIGTSWQQMVRMINDEKSARLVATGQPPGKMNYKWIYGEQQLMDSLRAGKPVMVMLDTGPNRAEGPFIPFVIAGQKMGGHWTVVYGIDYDTNTGNWKYYVTNWGSPGTDIKISRTNFRRGWGEDLKDGYGGSWLTKAAGTTLYGLVVWK